MNKPFGFDPTLFGELIARRWRENPGYYALNRNADHGWLEALWSQRADHNGVELHWIRRAGTHPPVELASPA